MTITNHLLSEIDDLIQAGQNDTAHERIQEISKNKIPRTLYSYFVRLCWRSGNFNIGLQLLNPLIKNRSAKLSTAEWIEYAMCLNNIGAVREAQTTLSNYAAPHELYSLYMAFSCIYQWDYEQAVTYLNKALSTLEPNSYFYSVAQINLLASLVAIEDFASANKLYLNLKTNLPFNYKRLHTNLTEIYLQMLCGEKKYAEGINFLNQQFSEKTLSGPEKIFFTKWKTILEVDAGISDKESLLLISRTAYDLSMWEVARDCETRYAFITKNPIFIKRVFFGTPWAKFRERIFNKFKDEIDFSQGFEMWLTPKDDSSLIAKTEPLILVDTNEGLIGKWPLKKGSLSHRLIKALSTDLYRPHSLGGLFSNLFEDERFDIATSPNRIYRAISELREIFEAENIPLEVRQIGTGYKLVPIVGVKFKMTPELPTAKVDFKINSLKTKFKEDFSAKEISDYLKVSIKTAQRLINSAMDSESIEKYKIKTSVRYRWKV